MIDFETDIKNPIGEDDLALILKPKFTNKKWNSTVDLSAVIMPSKKLEEEDTEQLRDVLYALVTCFHLLNTDSDFAKRVSDKMDQIAKEEGFSEYEDTPDNVIKLSTWTKTEGDLH